MNIVRFVQVGLRKVRFMQQTQLTVLWLDRWLLAISILRKKLINRGVRVTTCSDLVTTMCDDLYDNVRMLTNSVIVKCKVILATLQSIIIKWQH